MGDVDTHPQTVAVDFRVLHKLFDEGQDIQPTIAEVLLTGTLQEAWLERCGQIVIMLSARTLVDLYLETQVSSK